MKLRYTALALAAACAVAGHAWAGEAEAKKCRTNQITTAPGTQGEEAPRA